MTFEELFELESYLADACLPNEHFDLKEFTPIANLIGKTRYGIWDSHEIIGKWIVVTSVSSFNANVHFQYLLEHFSLAPKTRNVLMIKNEMGEYKILISVNGRN